LLAVLSFGSLATLMAVGALVSGVADRTLRAVNALGANRSFIACWSLVADLSIETVRSLKALVAKVTLAALLSGITLSSDLAIDSRWA